MEPLRLISSVMRCAVEPDPDSVLLLQLDFVHSDKICVGILPLLCPFPELSPYRNVLSYQGITVENPYSYFHEEWDAFWGYGWDEQAFSYIGDIFNEQSRTMCLCHFK